MIQRRAASFIARLAKQFPAAEGIWVRPAAELLLHYGGDGPEG